MDGHIMDETDFDAAFAEESGDVSGEEKTPATEEGVAPEEESEAASAKEEEAQESRQAGEAEPEAATDDSQGSAEGGPSSESEPEPEDEVSKLRQQLRAQDGRAAANDAKVKALEAKLAEMESRRGDPSERQAPAKVEIPEKLKGEAQEFRAAYPGLYPLLEEDSADGALARKQLEEYGVDQAAIWAKSVALERKVASLEAGMQATRQEVSGADHRERLAAAHPETRGCWSADPALQQEYNTFYDEVRAWVDTRPAYLRPAINQILEKGGADEVIAVLDDFKASRKTKTEQPLDAEKRRRAAAAGVVDSRHPVTPPRGAPDPDDYQGALVEAFGL